MDSIVVFIPASVRIIIRNVSPLQHTLSLLHRCYYTYHCWPSQKVQVLLRTSQTAMVFYSITLLRDNKNIKRLTNSDPLSSKLMTVCLCLFCDIESEKRNSPETIQLRGGRILFYQYSLFIGLYIHGWAFTHLLNVIEFWHWYLIIIITK